MEMERAAVRVCVLAGGFSDERDISRDSGANVVDALTQAGFKDVQMIDPAQDGFISRLEQGGFDVAFIAMHGEGGEDGKVQSLLEWMNIPYTASNVVASACAADKDISKLLYERAGIPTAPGVTLTRGVPYVLDEVLSVVGDQSFVKPAVNGSSYGITYVKEPSQLQAAIDFAFTFGDKVLIEKRIEGTEITVGVYGDDTDLRALPIVEILKQEDADFFDLRVKYISPEKIHQIPARLDAADYARAEELAVRAHRALGCFGVSRSDFIVSENGPVILETNTIPGMTDTSLYPDEIRHTDDLVFPEVCANLVTMAIERAKR